MCGGGGLKVSLIRYTLGDLVDFVQTGASGGRVNISGFVLWKLILCAKCATRMHFSPFHIMNTCSKDISPTYFSGLLSICQNKVAQRVKRCLAYRLVLNGRTSRGGLSDDANGVGGCLGPGSSPIRCRRHSRITSFTQFRQDKTYARANAPAKCTTDRKRSQDSSTRYAYTNNCIQFGMHRDAERRQPLSSYVCTAQYERRAVEIPSSHQHTIKSRRRSKKYQKHISNQNIFALPRASFGPHRLLRAAVHRHTKNPIYLATSYLYMQSRPFLFPSSVRK